MLLQAKEEVVGVRYVGDREQHVDNLYGTWLVWSPEQVHNVPVSIAERMRPHDDVYRLTAPLDSGEVDPEVTEALNREPEDAPPVLPHLDGMTKGEMSVYAQQHFGENFSKNMKVEDMRSKLLSLIQSRGV